MAALGSLARRRPHHPCLLPWRLRHSHTRSLWEELLGRKIEPSAAKKLEDAFLEYRVRKAVPSWLPFFPNGSFWIPSSEETIKNLEVLAEHIRVSKPSHKDRKFKPPPDSRGLSKVAEWSVIQQTDRLLSGRSLSDVKGSGSVVYALGGKGTIIEVDLDDEDEDYTEDDDDEDDCDIDSEEELDIVEKIT